MTGKTFTEFMDDLAYNPEMEFMFRGEIHDFRISHRGSVYIGVM